LACEMCGSQKGRLLSVEVEGVPMRLCQSCARFGTVLEPEPPEEERRPPAPSSADVSGLRIRGAAREPRLRAKPQKDVLAPDEEELVGDYHVRIRKAREAMGLNHEDLGKRINEKKSVIAKLENGTFRPDNALVRKLERFLNVKLKEKVEAVDLKRKDAGGPLTLGDFIKQGK